MDKQLAEYASSNGRQDERTEAEIDAAMFEHIGYQMSTGVAAVAGFDLVEPDRSCTCGERRMDWLVWTDDAINVRCATCGEVFRPGAGA